MPMSTTWVFLGLLAGREIALTLNLKHRSKKELSQTIYRDAGKAFLGSVVAIGLALLLPIFVTPVLKKEAETNPPSTEAE